MVQAVYQMVVQMNGCVKGQGMVQMTFRLPAHMKPYFFARPSIVKVPFSRVTARTQKPWHVLFPLNNSSLFVCRPIHYPHHLRASLPNHHYSLMHPTLPQTQLRCRHYDFVSIIHDKRFIPNGHCNLLPKLSYRPVSNTITIMPSAGYVIF